MIQKSKASVIPILNEKPAQTQTEENGWKHEMQHLIKDSDILLDLVEIHDINIRKAAKEASKLFPLKVTKTYAEGIKKGDINDPLLRQVLPLDSEFIEDPNFNNDPTGDKTATQSTGLLHKYHGRVLLVLTGLCAIHCRYCFRREYPYESSSASRKEWSKIAGYIQNDSSITEVILSGGDPLVLDNNKLASLLDILEPIKHIKRIRIHSRLPVVLPSRIDDDLCSLLSQYRFKFVLVIHANHANELSQEVEQAITKLRHENITVLNQAVLLAGVNDNLESLARLSEKLFSINVMPYYLHTLDKVNGTSHFNKAEPDIDALYKNLQNHLPGYLVPKLVRDLPETASKQLWHLK